MKRRPSIALFISALLGAFLGFELNVGLLGAVLSIFFLSLIIINISLIRVFAFLCFTTFFISYAAHLSLKDFTHDLNLLPKNKSKYQGVIENVSKKENGSLIVLVRINLIGAHSKIFLKLNLIESAANLSLLNGHQIYFNARVRKATKPLSSVYFDSFRYGLANNIHGRATISSARNIWQGEKLHSNVLTDVRNLLTKNIMNTITPREASLLLALIIGDTNLFSHEQYDTYKSIGAQHLLAVSGLQVTLIQALCFFLLLPIFGVLLPFNFSHHAQLFAALFTTILAFCFIGICGFPPSASRAFLMAIIMFVPTVLNRKVDLFDAFFVSGFLFVAINPKVVLDLGFLLSYAAVLGLLVAHVRSSRIRDYLACRSIVLHHLIMLIIISVAAFLATLPVLVIYFRTVSPFSPMANFFLVPIATFLQIPVILLGLLGGLVNLNIIIKISAFIASLLEICAEVLSDFFGGIIYLPHLSSLSLFLFSVFVLITFWCLLQFSRYIFLFAISLLLFPLGEAVLYKKTFLATVIPVGQGDSTLMSFPNGQNMLVDAGGQVYGDFDPGERIVVPTLKRKGVKTIDVLAITHPDPDHILGAFAIIDNFIVGSIWHNGAPTAHPLTDRLIKVAKEKNIYVLSPKQILGVHHFGSTVVEVLAPKGYKKNLSSNDNSLVLRITHENTSLLLPGDIEVMGEKNLLQQRKDLRSYILKAPHHGSKTSSSLNFITAVAPKHVIYSTGVDNRFKFPHKEVVSRYKSLSVSQWDTAKNGEITILIDKKRVDIKGYRP